MLKKSIRRFYKKCTAKYWTIGFTDRKSIEELMFNDIKWVKPMKGEWIADPFILDYDDHTISVLVENAKDEDGFGSIAKVVVSRETLRIVSKATILSLPTHLSFPVIVRKEGEVYFYPENSASGELNLYKLNEKQDGCEKLCRLVDAPLTDAIIYEIPIDGLYYMTATIEPGSNKNHLQVYVSEYEFGPYTLNRDVFLADNTARNAGYTLSGEGDKLYKISQENNARVYGHGMVFYETTASFDSFRTVNVIQPRGKYIGVHTMNPYKDLIVWDGTAYRHPFIARIMGIIYHLFKKLL